MSPPILADECCDASLVKALREDGHDLVYVGEDQSGLTDEEVLNAAFTSKRILLTEDKDFGELTIRMQKPVHGFVLIRLHPAQRSLKISRMRLLLNDYGDRLAGHYTVVGPDRFRFRPLGVS